MGRSPKISERGGSKVGLHSRDVVLLNKSIEQSHFKIWRWEVIEEPNGAEHWNRKNVSEVIFPPTTWYGLGAYLRSLLRSHLEYSILYKNNMQY